MEQEIRKFKKLYPTNWRQKLLVAKNAIRVDSNGVEFIKTTLVGFVYQNSARTKLLPERLYGTEGQIIEKFNQMKRDFKSLDLEISSCPIEYDKWSKIIKAFDDQEYQDAKDGIDFKSLEELENELPL